MRKLVFEKKLRMSGYSFIQYNLWKTKNIKHMLKSRRWFEHRTLRFFVSTLTNCNRMLYHLAIETTSHVYLLQLNLIFNLPLTYSTSFGVDSMLLCYSAVQSSCHRIINGNALRPWSRCRSLANYLSLSYLRAGHYLVNHLFQWFHPFLSPPILWLLALPGTFITLERRRKLLFPWNLRLFIRHRLGHPHMPSLHQWIHWIDIRGRSHSSSLEGCVWGYACLRFQSEYIRWTHSLREYSAFALDPDVLLAWDCWFNL